jgi:hypothetical protein
MHTRLCIVIAGILLVAITGCAPKNYEALEQQVGLLTAQNEVIAVANRLFLCTDKRDWQCVKDVFAPEVLFDMTSLSGGHPSRLTPQQIADGWDQGLKNLKAIHHQAGNYQTTLKGKEADLFCYGIAFHYLPNPSNQNTRTFVGSYDFHLVRTDAGWKIDRFKFNLKYIEGNKDLGAVSKESSQ